MKSIKNILLIIALLFSFPASAFMADNPQGKIIINIYDETNKPYVGNWFLYQGMNDKGFLVRNGSSGETFNFTPGKYFLVIYKSEEKHPYRAILSANPQVLNENETITFDIQYYKTAEEMANPTALTVTEPVPAEPVVATTPVISEPSESTDTTTDTSDSTDIAGYSRTYMGPRVTLADLPDTDVSPAADSGSSIGGSENLPLALAQTGSPAFLLLIFSGLLGGIAVRRKK